MNKDIYGVIVVHPKDIIEPAWECTLPEKTGENVRYFDSIDGVIQAISDCNKGGWHFSERFGLSHNQRLTIGSIGIVYRVSIADESLAYAQQKRQKTANAAYLFSAPLPVDAIQDTVAIIPEDFLHNLEIVDMPELVKLINQRKQNMTALNDLIRKSTPEQKARLNLDDKKQQSALRLLYGNNGLITNPSMLSNNQQFSAVLNHILSSDSASIIYALQSTQLYGIYNKETSNVTDKSQKLRAVKAVLQAVANLADSQCDFKMRSFLYSMQNQLNKDIAAAV